jgi:hypothetical protein
MAGAGRKVFTAGDVLTASQVQDYLQDQAVMVFAGTAARSAAIATPTEGMLSYQKDTDAIEAYDGTNWVNRVSTSVPFATNAGTATATFTAAATASVAITFTSGRFTQTPIITCAFEQPTGSGTFWVHRLVSATTSGATFNLSTYNAATITATVRVNFIANQMTSAAAAG